MFPRGRGGGERRAWRNRGKSEFSAAWLGGVWQRGRRQSPDEIPTAPCQLACWRRPLRASFFLSFFFSTAGDDLFRVIRDDRKLQRVHWPKRRETSARVDSRKRSSPRGGRSNRRCCVKSFVCSPRTPSTRWMPMIKLSSVFLKFSVLGIYARFAFFKLHVLFCEEAVATNEGL